jgi:cytidine deaminase
MPQPPVHCVSEEVLAALIQSASEVRLRAHSPYSGFAVGAALLCDNGDVFVGCNVENVSFSLTICAERAAAATAVAAGQRSWTAIAIVSSGGVTPCGACRQFLAEFASDLRVICVDASSSSGREYTLSQLLPQAFDREALGR